MHPGDVLAGKYRVDRVLGRGGMGVVLAVTNLESDAPRALKLLGPEAQAHETTVERFFREARATARLTGEHAVRVYEVGLLASGAPYMTMEYLEGSDLGAEVKRRGALPAHEAALYVYQACQAVGEAHDHGVVHRDLKPRNLFLTRRPDGSPCIKVLDFGISKQLFVPEGQDELTQSNAVLGSPAYMSPEQIRSARSVDPRTDIWSLGVVLYQLVTGRLPFQNPSTTELIAMIVQRAPAPPSQVRRGLPLALDAVVLRCLEKDPDRRFARASELAGALALFVPSLGAAIAPERSSRPRTRRLLLLAAAGVLVAAGLAAALLWHV